MKSSVTKNLTVASEYIRKAIREASNNESINDLQELVDLLVVVEELAEKTDCDYQFNFDNVVINGGSSSDTIDLSSYYNPFEVGGDYIVGASGADTISFG